MADSPMMAASGRASDSVAQRRGAAGRKRGEAGQRKATIFDVAAEARVSIKTVSRVVNSEPNVRERTRERVLEAVRRLRYQPNAAARSLSGGRSWVLGLVYAKPQEFSYMKDVLDGALHACDERGHTLLLRPLAVHGSQVSEQVERFVAQARVEGVMLPAPMGDHADLLSSLRRMEVPFAAIAPKVSAAGQVNVFCEEREASRALTDFLVQRGHRNIGFIKGDPAHRATGERFAGYREALAKRGIRHAEELVREGNFDFESGKAAGAALLNLPRPPTAIVASNDDMAAGLQLAARERGLAIPQDLSVVGFDDTPLASRLWPPLTTVRQPIREMAKTAAERLMDRLNGRTVDPSPAPFACELVIRASTT